MSKFKVGQVWVTRDGRKARIVATDFKHSHYPIVGLVERLPNGETAECFTTEGIWDSRTTKESRHDLIREYREPREVWVMYAHGQGLPIDVAAKYCNDSRWVKFREVIE